MNKLFSLILCLLFVLLSSCGEHSGDQNIEASLLSGHFLRISDEFRVLVLDEETREHYPNDVYMRLVTDHPFIAAEDQVSLDAFSDGDRIAVDCMTIADLSPRVIDVTAAKLLNEGTIEDVDIERLVEHVDDGDLSDIDAALLEWAGK